MYWRRKMAGGFLPGEPQLPTTVVSREGAMLDALIAQYREDRLRPVTEYDRWGYWYPEKLPLIQEILALPPEGIVRFVSELLPRLLSAARAAAPQPCGEAVETESFLRLVLLVLLDPKLPLREADYQAFFEWCAITSFMRTGREPGLAETLARLLADRGALTEKIRAPLAELQAKVVRRAIYNEERRFAQRLEEILGTAAEIPLEPGEVWTDAAIANLSAAVPEDRNRWAELLRHCRDADGSAPKKAWLRKTESLLREPAIHGSFHTRVADWFAKALEPRTGPSQYLEHYQQGRGGLDITDAHQAILRGLAWACSLTADSALVRALATLAIGCYAKVSTCRGRGPRAIRVGNACVWTLGEIGGGEALSQLTILRAKVKNPTAQKKLDVVLAAVAKRAGLVEGELEEMDVPRCGLADVGSGSRSVGNFQAHISIAGSKATITWQQAGGPVQRSVPSAVKAQAPAELKALNTVKKEIETMLSAQSARLESIYLQQRSWPLAVWRERYLDHPLVGTLARRLIWSFTIGHTTTPGIWLDGKLVDQRRASVPLEAGHTTVALWHPFDQPPELVLDWRVFLEEHRLTQPFKQAHREIYLLTPAEETTRFYSNRFAAHLLKQQQFHALCQARGWKDSLRVLINRSFPPSSRTLRQYGLRAEFWVEGAGEEYGRDTNQNGSFLYLTTDQVRFYPLDAPQLSAHPYGGGYGPRQPEQRFIEPIPLTEVPPLAFSEIMRDVDLFVGVASVANDPNWTDGGQRETDTAYWSEVAFGELSATAQTRRDLLQRLVSKLKIADRCSFADKFLVVRGDLRTYKIHLGSGNILMSPNDRYLCIVPGAGKAEDGKVFLPFEGDRTLSVILSKAFLLAADTKITDPSITAQLRLT